MSDEPTDKPAPDVPTSTPTIPDPTTPRRAIQLDPLHIEESFGAVLMANDALQSANSQLKERLRAAIALNQEMANTLAVLIETHGIDDPVRGGKTLSVHKSMIPVVDQTFVEARHDDGGRVYFTVVHDPEELRAAGFTDSNRPGRVVRREGKRRGGY